MSEALKPANQKNAVDIEARIRQLEAERDAALKSADAALSRADAAEARATAMETEGSDRRYLGDKPVLSATRHKPLRKFRVHCAAAPKGHPELADETISAVDESEAVRQFCLLRKDEKGRQLDPPRYSFTVTCLDEKERQQKLNNRINNRRLVNAGKLNVLTREEEFLPPEENAKRQRQQEMAMAS